MINNLIIKIFLLIVLLYSCKSKLETRHYQSLVDSSGYNQFDLRLSKNGKLELRIMTSRAIPSESIGDSWTEYIDTTRGLWSFKNNKINCIFFDTKSDIDKVFDNSDFKEFKNRELLFFSNDMDTAYIYGIPCTLEKIID